MSRATCLYLHPLSLRLSIDSDSRIRMHDTGMYGSTAGAEGREEYACSRIIDSFMSSLRSGSQAVSGAKASRVCLFSIDFCVAACMAVSDLADSEGGVRVPTFCDTRVPGWVGPGTDAVVVSGADRSENGRLYDALRSRGCRVHCIMPAGSLSDRAVRDGSDFIAIPDGMDSSDAVAFSLGALCALVSDMGIMDARRVLDEVLSEPLAFTVPEGISTGDLVGVYSTSDVGACSKRWADLVMEVRGIPAFRGELPEYDHNELVGWSDPNIHSEGLRMIVLRSEPDEGMVSLIVKHMLEVLSENGRVVEVVDIGAGSTLARDVRGMILADVCIRRGA